MIKNVYNEEPDKCACMSIYVFMRGLCKLQGSKAATGQSCCGPNQVGYGDFKLKLTVWQLFG
jgi:hypothetical protein